MTGEGAARCGAGGPQTIGVLYESDEWSDHKIAAELRRALDAEGFPSCGVRMIDMEDPSADEAALACDLLVSRVFASAQFRGHEASLARMDRLVEAAARRGVAMVNPGRAHRFETDKRRATEALAAAGIAVPAIYACGMPDGIDLSGCSYPCIVKPNCGGRTTCTEIARDEAGAEAFLADAPPIGFVVEEYIEPERGYVTRIEIVDGSCALVVKRSIAGCGLSAYRFGSTYESYDECPQEVLRAAERASRALDIAFGSFDVIECSRGAFFIDANSVSNVSEDCTDLLGIDLMRAHADGIVRHAVRSGWLQGSRA